jgi:hypothetical protein
MLPHEMNAVRMPFIEEFVDLLKEAVEGDSRFSVDSLLGPTAGAVRRGKYVCSYKDSINGLGHFTNNLRFYICEQGYVGQTGPALEVGMNSANRVWLDHNSSSVSFTNETLVKYLLDRLLELNGEGGTFREAPQNMPIR